MQTFLPHADFKETARSLDRQRLGKQRVEAWQVLRALNGMTKGWRNHPAVLMWNGYEKALCEYAIAICDEWIARGYNDTMRERFVQWSAQLDDNNEQLLMPPWIGNQEFHKSHQSNLVRKFPEYYKQQFPDVPDHLEYLWPVSLDKQLVKV